MKLTVFFDGQFWVGLIEWQTEAGLFVSRHIFGAEPKDEEIFAFVNQQLTSIVNSQTVSVAVKAERRIRINPKRMAREVAREMKAAPVSTKAQEVLKLQLAENKRKKRVLTKEQKRKKQEEKWLLRQKKAKQKHRGR